MDKYSEEQQLNELTTRIIDNLQIVSRKDVSNLFLIHYEIVEALMRKWISLNSERSLELKYECNGLHEKGFYLFQIATEKENAKWIQKGFLSAIHSIALQKGSKKSFNIDTSNILIKRIITDAGHRNYLNPVVEEDVKPLKKPKSFFGVPSTSSKTITLKSSLKAEAVQVKEEESMDIDPKSEPSTSKVSKKSPKATENSNETKASEESPKASTSSDKKETPKKSPDEQKKVNKKKDIKSLPPVGGKSSIASFFGNKPASTSTIAEKVEPKIEKTKKLEKSEKVQVVELQKSLDVMMISDDEIPCTPEAIKPKKQTKNDSQKRSRIKQIVDSSDEDEPKEEIVKEPESKVAKLNESKKKSSKPETSRKKSKESSKSEKVTESKKVAKKSEKLEKDTEVSVSENESEPTIAQPTEALKPAKENEKPANEKKTAPKPGKKLTKKEMKNQPPGKNQGTITSFFTKK